LNLRSTAASADSSRKLLVAFGFVVTFAGAAYEFAELVLAGDMMGFAYVALLAVGGVFIIASLNNWRNGVYFFFTWLLFEDLARKYLGNNMAAYFAKSVLFAVVYLSLFISVRRKKTAKIVRPPFFVAVMLLVWFGIMQIFNPASTTIVYGLLGVKLFFWYIPLYFVGYAFFDSEADLRRFFNLNAWLALVITGLGVAQSIIGPAFLNPARPADEIRELSTLYHVSPIIGLAAYRAPSVFVSAGRYTNFLLIAWMLILAFTGYLLLRHRRGRNIAFSLAVIYAAVILLGFRGAFLWTAGVAIIIAFAFLWGAPWRQREVLRVFRTLQHPALGIALAIVALFFVYPDALLSRLVIYSENLTPGAPNSELQNRTWDYPLRNFSGASDYDRWPYGFGIGTSSLGVQYVARTFHAAPMGVGVESGFGSAWKVFERLRGSPRFPLALSIFLYATVLLPSMTFTSMVAHEDFVINAYFWLMLGILFRLPTLPLSSQFASAPTPASGTRLRAS
jgi:hypothetical protein